MIHVIHILKAGMALCKPGFPSNWNDGDRWVAIDDAKVLELTTCEGCRSVYTTGGLPPPVDTPVGFDRAPDRYMAHGRETIDRMRDRAFVVAEAYAGAVGAADEVTNALADLLFIYHCEVTAMKYEDRAGRKGDEGDEQQDRDKALFYRRMAAHVRGFGPDPRVNRADFMAYRRPG